MTPDRLAFIAAVLAAAAVVAAWVLVVVRLRRPRISPEAARLRARLFEVGMEIERERDAAAAAVARFHIATNRAMEYDREHKWGAPR